MNEKSYYRIIFQKFFNKSTAKYSLIFVLLLIFIAFLYPIFSKTGYDEINLDKVLLPPSAEHWFGTDALGRDVFARVVYGGRVSLLVGFVSEGIAIVIGVILGSISGYFGGKVDSFIMRITDIMLCIPTFFLIISATAYVEPSIWNIMLIIGLTGWMSIARLVRGEFLSLREREFVLYEKTIGNKNIVVMFKHILPNALNPVIVSASFGIAGAILTETALSFLGLGVQPPVPSWGNILTSGRDILEIAWWISLFPGMFILLSVLCYNLIGEGLKDALNPRQYD